MRIRSVTVFTDADPARPDEALGRAGRVAALIRQRLSAGGYEVQTVRAALPPPHRWLRGAGFAASARKLDAAAALAGIDYLSLGPVVTGTGEDLSALRALPEVFAETLRVFASACVTAGGAVLCGELQPVAETILRIAQAPPTGFNNLRFAALANCPPGTPFFPAAYAEPGRLSFALATESADLALEACRAAGSHAEALNGLCSAIEKHGHVIEPLMDAAAAECGAAFTGSDWSLAPHPDEACSIGAALESLNGSTVGDWGTLAAVATLTRAIRQARVRRVGFSGVFLPVLEDAVLARRSAEGRFDLQRLLLYSAVCGAGLDTIPLPGGVAAGAVAGLLGDVAAMSLVLQKPLTVRLMPVPGLANGERTRFEFPYLVNTAPLALDGGAPGILRGLPLPLA